MIPLRERCNGRWRSILPALGIDPSFLTGKHGPCPICGGRDRWRFDDKSGDGSWICAHCGAGQGIKLALRFTGLPFKDLAQQIECIVGEAPREPARPERSQESKRAALNGLWQAGRAVRPGDPVDLWMHHRGVGSAVYPNTIQTCMRVRYTGPPVSFHPAMLAMVTDPAGRPVMIHRTFLTTAGTKASVEKPRMFCCGSIPAGSAVRLAKPGPILGVAEGIETAFAAMMLFNISVWAALNADLLSKFEPPAETERLVIFGDNDANGTGQKGAYALAARLAPRMQIEVRIPEVVDTDWNDVSLAGGG